MRISDWSSDVCSSDLLDARIDARMTRTSWRPIVVGQITPRAAFIFALVLAVLSMTVLLVWVNVLTAVLTFASLIGYAVIRSEEHTSELQSLMRISYAVFCLKKKNNKKIKQQ